jgi:lipoprotein-releasing system ATP-binding protein
MSAVACLARPAPLLVCDNVVRQLGNAATACAVDGVSLSVWPAEMLAITGSSGSGKSTLLYLLGALDRPSRGRILAGDIELGSADESARADYRLRRLGFVFQFHFLLPEFTVLENVMIPLLRRGDLTQREVRARATAVLHELGLAELAGRRPSQLSGGQQQRVSVARAIAPRPKLLLADEPTGNLDSRNGEAVMDLFEQLVAEHGVGVVLVTHEPRFAARAAHRLVMRDGRVLEDTRPG